MCWSCKDQVLFLFLIIFFSFHRGKWNEMESTPTDTQNTKVIVKMQVIHKEMSIIWHSILFLQKNKLDRILFKFKFSYVAIGCGSHPSTLLIGDPRLVHVSAFMNNHGKANSSTGIHKGENNLCGHTGRAVVEPYTGREEICRLQTLRLLLQVLFPPLKIDGSVLLESTLDFHCKYLNNNSRYKK